MHLTIPSRRSAVAALALVLTGGGLLATAGPSHAAALGLSQLQTVVNFDDDPLGVHTCTTTGPGDATSGPVATFAADGVPVTRTVSSNAVITDNAVAADKTTMSGSATATVTATQSGGEVTNVHLAATAAASLTTAIAATNCGASVTAGGGVQFQFNLAAPALVTVTAEGHNMTGILAAGNIMGPIDNGNAVISYTLGGHGLSSASTLLPAGTGYIGISELTQGIDAPSTASTISKSGDFVADLTFQAPGAASSGQTGAAGKYVSLDAVRSCTAGTLGLTWSKKAGHGKNRVIKKATVTVNGAKVATIRKPKKHQVSTLTGLSGDKAADIEVVLKIKGKGKLTAERSYLRCT